MAKGAWRFTLPLHHPLRGRSPSPEGEDRGGEAVDTTVRRET